jgi:hypothetical protein
MLQVLLMTILPLQLNENENRKSGSELLLHIEIILVLKEIKLFNGMMLYVRDPMKWNFKFT